MRCILATFALVLAAAPASAQAAPEGAPHAAITLPDQITWGPAPAILPAGAQLAVVEGNPMEAGPFTMRLRMPSGYRLPPHHHPFVEHVTVMKGTFEVGMGDKFDTSKLTALPTGTFAAIQPGVRHYARAKGETVLQLHGTGPWTLIYVNPADAPAQATP